MKLKTTFGWRTAAAALTAMGIQAYVINDMYTSNSALRTENLGLVAKNAALEIAGIVATSALAGSETDLDDAVALYSMALQHNAELGAALSKIDKLVPGRVVCTPPDGKQSSQFRISDIFENQQARSRIIKSNCRFIPENGL